MSDISNDRMRASADSLAEGMKRKQRTQQSRQLLSCTKCRERKVKCDRTKPCSACCARGAPKECHFVAEGGDYTPIQQSYELRKLRAENMRLKERLRASKIPIEDDDSDAAASPESQPGERLNNSSQKRRAARQKRFQGAEWTDSIYFGSPGLANVITDFAAANLSPMSAQSLAHLMPHGPDIYTPKSPLPFPFPTLFHATPDQCIPQLLKILPSDEQLLEYLDAFEKRITVCSFPHVSIEITKSEVERFLSHRRKNATMCPDMLALLFAAMALGALHSVWDKGGGQWNSQIIDEELQKGNVYIAASMQALRMASFLHKPTILAIETLIMMGPYLTHSGRFVEAWTLFGTTIRMAQSIGLHRNPKYLDPAPPTQRECGVRQTLWWWMLHMDEQYSMTLGRPLGISGIGDCPPPHELTTDPQMLRFGDFVNHFTLLARQILSGGRLTDARIDEFTDLLKALLDTMPEMLQFNESWVREDTEIPEWPLGAMAAVYYCKTHTYLVLLNRQRSEKNTGYSQTPSNKPSLSPFRPINQTPSSHSSPTTPTTASLRGRSLVISSSEDLLTAFLFFYHRAPAALISWTISQQAFNSCMLLLLDALELGKITPGILKVEQAYAVFRELQTNGVHRLASLAVERISWGLQELQQIVNLSTEVSTAQGYGRGNDPDTQKVTKHQASHGLEKLRDTVMSNKGMLLLEDPGLQSFVPETFEAFSWIMPGTDELSGPSSLKQEMDESIPEGSNDISAETWRLATEQTPAHCTTTQQSPSYQPPVSLVPSSSRQRFDDAKTAVPSRQKLGLSPRSRHTIPRETAKARQRHCHSCKTSDVPPTQSRHRSCPSLFQASVPSLPRPAHSYPSKSRRPSAVSSAELSPKKLVISVSAPGQPPFFNGIMPPSDRDPPPWPTQLPSTLSVLEPVMTPTTRGYLQDKQTYRYDFSGHYSNAIPDSVVTVPVSNAEMG